jgi:hypothetical protein
VETFTGGTFNAIDSTSSAMRTGRIGWRGPGHCGLLHDGGRDLIVYHAYDAQHDAAPTLRLAELRWDELGWPSAQT